MNKKLLWIMALLLIVPMLLAACGGDLSEDDAEKGINAVFAGDRDEAEKFVCEEELDELSSESTMPEGTDVSVSCTKDDDKMNCDVAVSGDAVGGSMTMPISFNIEDGKLCGGEVGEPEFDLDTVPGLPTEEAPAPEEEATEAAN